MSNTPSTQKFSIRITIISTFVSVFVLLAGLALGTQYYFSLELAGSAAKRAFENTSDQAREHLETLDEQNSNMVKVVANYIDLLNSFPKGQGFIGRGEYPMLSAFTESMRRNRHLSAVYVTSDGKDFLELVNLDSGEGLREFFGAGNEDRWVVLNISKEVGQGLRKISLFDEELNLRAVKVESSDYIPEQRPWYRLAMEKRGVVRTAPYVFHSPQTLGLTYAQRTSRSGEVVGLDMSLEGLFDFLRRQDHFPGSELTLFDLNGKVFAHGQVGPRRGERVSASKDILGAPSSHMLSLTLPDKGKAELGRYKLNDVLYYYYAEHLNFDLDAGFYLGITVPADTVVGPYVKQVKVSIAVTLGLLLLVSPLIWYFAALIVRPIKALCRENDKVGLRQFERVGLVDSRIKEVFELSQSILDMARAIKAHEEAQRNLLDSIIKLIGGAIDAKSPYTGGHCSRVPVIANLLAKAACAAKEGPFANFDFKSLDDWREFQIAAWLHDCGKVTTPEYVVDKATKLETIYNRIHEIRTRFEVLLRDAEISYYQQLALNPFDVEALKTNLECEVQAIKEDFSLVAECNVGGEFMSDEKVSRLREIAKRTWVRNLDNRIGLSQEELRRMDMCLKREEPVEESILSDRQEHIVERLQDPFGDHSYGFSMDVPENLYNHGELYNLCIQRGTLSPEERFKINEHIVQTIRMLEALPFPKGLERVPEYAGAHHETLVGTGYPRRLSKNDMSVPARIMAVADVFEALTASDRPYKTPKTLSQTLQIMASMAKRNHLDPDLFELFLTSGVYLEYATIYLDQSQIDSHDVSLFIM